MPADDVPITVKDKCFGTAQRGRSVSALVRAGTALSELPTPVATLDAGALEHNLGVMSSYVRQHRVGLAPHGKTTMSPDLWRRQIDAGAWGITVATGWQLRVALDARVRKIMQVGPILDDGVLAEVAAALTTDPEVDVVAWADHVDAVALMAARFPSSGRPLPVLVERGVPAGRTGARTLDEAIAVAEAVAASDNLTLGGIAFWEGSMHAGTEPQRRHLVETLCSDVVDTFDELERRELLSDPIVTAGGSAYFDLVLDGLTPISDRARILLRSGCYLTHDDGVYAEISPLKNGPQSFRPALHVWARVISRPQDDLVLIDAGRRDVPFDAGLPRPIRLLGSSREQSLDALAGAALIEVNDQHGYLRVPPASSLRIGDTIGFGISHPCTAFDKWPALPVVADSQALDPMLVGLARTMF
ncbi:alanine racemase [Jiangella muralis]|uniref:alanine racemase n=1 Tax=Jiangella muralis TaxID=702383 RepID=UPI00069F5F87|nr:alanine racemase [Jiangella muralis]